MKNTTIISCLFAAAVGFIPVITRADEPAAASLKSSAAPAPASNTRYGLFDWLDHRSDYGQGVFPEPFLVDDSDLEENEARLDWLRTANGSDHSDTVKAEVEKGFGLLTLEIEVPYVRESSEDGASQGFDNVDLGARYPIFQYVSAKGFVDSTIGAGVEAGFPVDSRISRSYEFVPKIFNDLKLGEHVTLQSIIGYSALFGGDDDGLQTFEYGFDLGYTILYRQLPLPGVLEVIPVFEVAGETQLNKDDPGHNSVLGNLAMRVNFKTIGWVQPRLGVGFVFPLDAGAHADVHCGVVTSLVFEY